MPVTLPHPLRPAVPEPAALSDAGHAVIWWVVAMVVVVALLGWWGLRQRQSGRVGGAPGRTSNWRDLETAVGTVDWYERFGQRLCALHGYGQGDHHRTARLLASLAADEVGRPWQHLARRWEWAIYAGHPGTATEHQADLQLARARWP
jgi:hypothetical protein